MKIKKIKRRNSFISEGKNENRQDWEWCGISNGRTITKIVYFLNFDSFPNLKNSEIFFIFQFRKFIKFLIHKIPKD